jgi:hypothetical protein
MGLFILWIILACVVGAIATDKTMGFWGGFLWSFFLSPVIGLIIVLASKSNAQQQQENQMMHNQVQQTQVLSQLSKANQSTATDELLKLKKLLDDKAITQEEYEKMKSKIIS